MNIPDEAVEAAARAYYEGSDWEDLAVWFRQRCLDSARTALEAAAPHMLAEAWKQGLNTGSGLSVWAANQRPNPYRSHDLGGIVPQGLSQVVNTTGKPIVIRPNPPRSQL